MDTRYTLIKRLQDQHNDEAWKTFTSIYESYIFNVLIRAGATHDDAIDLRQDILIKLWKKLPELDFQPGKTKFRTWLYRVIHNSLYTHFSSRKSEKDRVNRYFSEKSDELSESDPLQKLMDNEWRSYLTKQAHANIAKTANPKHLEVFTRMLKGESPATLAEELQLNENTIYRIRNRTRDKLTLEIARLRKDLE